MIALGRAWIRSALNAREENDMGWIPEYSKNNVGRIIAGVDFITSRFTRYGSFHCSLGINRTFRFSSLFLLISLLLVS
ncbi:Uncharacterised protein [Vibrio cholerae]|uniref:Uncharacterized protein n=1 Tax=Vibrio cholerae TaxID=666 RepID=A0A656AFQ1_VIBCL|nr:Uncharacterised protein [Vibrio cholerae]CSD14596.1 Uncharacterised protein [Vibrio cholerae]